MRILISGAGIAGPTLAYFLARIGGSRVTIVERTKELLPHGQNIDIKGSARVVIERMHLMEEVVRMNTTEAGTQILSPTGAPIAIFPVNKSASFTSELEILRGDLAKVLYDATRDLPNVRYLFGTTIKEVHDQDRTDASSVMVTLSNGEEQEYDLLVAADGQWSKVRKQVFTAPDDELTIIDKGMYGVYWTAPRTKADNNMWNLYFALRRRVVSVRPDPHGTVRPCFTIMPRTDAQKDEWQRASKSFDRATQQALVQREFADAGWEAQRLMESMEAAPDFYFQAVQQIRMNRWSNTSGSARVALLGDAAWAPTPLTGAGTSLAIIGAYVLAGELSKLTPGQHPREALQAYDTAFRPFVESEQSIPSFVPGIAHPETSWGRWALQSFLRVMNMVITLPFIARRLKEPPVEEKRHIEDFPLPSYPVLADPVSDSKSPSGL